MPYFNKKLDELGITKNNYKIKEKNIINTNTNSSNILSQKFNKTNFNYNPSLFKSFSGINNLMNLKTAEEISDELKNNIKDDKKINIFKMSKNFFKTNKKDLFDDNSKSTMNTPRKINYSELNMNETRKLNNKFTLYQNNKNLPKINSSNNIFDANISSKNKFDQKLFFKYLSYYTVSSYKESCEKKYLKKKKLSNKIKEIVLYIIDMTMEGYIYQNEHKSEIIDINTFYKFYIYFMKNKPLRKKYIPVELVNYKRSGKIEQIYDRKKICNDLTNDEKNWIEDYIYYLGVWNDDKIIKNNMRGIRFNYKYITNKNYAKENNKNN